MIQNADGQGYVELKGILLGINAHSGVSKCSHCVLAAGPSKYPLIIWFWTAAIEAFVKFRICGHLRGRETNFA